MSLAPMAAEAGMMLAIDRRLATEMSIKEPERPVPFATDAITVAMRYGAHSQAQIHDREDQEREPCSTHPTHRRRGDAGRVLEGLGVARSNARLPRWRHSTRRRSSSRLCPDVKVCSRVTRCRSGTPSRFGRRQRVRGAVVAGVCWRAGGLGGGPWLASCDGRPLASVLVVVFGHLGLPE